MIQKCKTEVQKRKYKSTNAKLKLTFASSWKIQSIC